MTTDWRKPSRVFDW